MRDQATCGSVRCSTPPEFNQSVKTNETKVSYVVSCLKHADFAYLNINKHLSLNKYFSAKILTII